MCACWAVKELGSAETGCFSNVTIIDNLEEIDNGQKLVLKSEYRISKNGMICRFKSLQIKARQQRSGKSVYKMSKIHASSVLVLPIAIYATRRV